MLLFLKNIQIKARIPHLKLMLVSFAMQALNPPELLPHITFYNRLNSTKKFKCQKSLPAFQTYSLLKTFGSLWDKTYDKGVPEVWSCWRECVILSRTTMKSMLVPQQQLVWFVPEIFLLQWAEGMKPISNRLLSHLFKASNLNLFLFFFKSGCLIGSQSWTWSIIWK